MKRILSFLLLFLTMNCFAKVTADQPHTFAQKDIFQTAHFLKNIPGLVNDCDSLPIRYFASHDGVTVYLTDAGPIYKLVEKDEKRIEEMERERKHERKEGKPTEEENERGIPLKVSYTKVRWIGSNPHPVIDAIDKASGYFIYMLDPKSSKRHTVMTDGFSKIIYHDIYPGIDVEYSFPEKGGVKYNYIVHPGADPSLININFSGPVDKINSDINGNMIISTQTGKMMEHAPESFLSSGEKVPSSFKIEGNKVSFRFSKGYDHSKTLVIDPWISAITQMTVRNLGADIDYDVNSNLYVYGAGSDGALDTFNYEKLAKYSSTGAFVWVFNGGVSSIGWNSIIPGSGITVLSNAKVDKTTSKIYVGQKNFNGSQVIRLNSLGVYDNFESALVPDFEETWSFAANCNTGEVLALGGSTTSDLNMGVVNTTSGALSTSNFTGVLGTANSQQDVVSGTYDANGSLYVVIASDVTNFIPNVDNTIMKVNTAYNGPVWGPNATGYTAFSEFSNMPAFDNLNQSSNNFNALAANGSYVYYYDGKHLKAFSLTTGAAVGTAVSIAGQTALCQGGIAVDRCNHIYIGGKGAIKTYTFNGSTFTAGTSISLGAGFTTDTVFDVRYDANNQLLYATGTNFVGVYNATLSTTCIVSYNYSDSVVTRCLGAKAIVTPGIGLVNPQYTFIWKDSLGNIIRQSPAGTVLVDSFTAPHAGLYTVGVVLNVNCGSQEIIDTFHILDCNNLTHSPDTSICKGQSVLLSANGTPTGGSYLWMPGGASSSSVTVTPNVSTLYTVTYTPITGAAIKDTIHVKVNTANAGPDQFVSCIFLPGGSATLAAADTGIWVAQSNNPGTATITTPASPTTTITNFSVAGTYNFTWITSHGCIDTAAVIVTAKPNAGADQTVTCYPFNTTATMSATGTGTWSTQAGNPGTATITTPTSPTTTITTLSAAGTYNFIWTNASGCKDTASVIVTNKPNAGSDQNVLCATLPGGTATMAGTGTGIWSAQTGNPGTATITTPTSPTTTITAFTTAGTYNFIWTNGGCSDTASIVVTAKPNAGTDQTVNCAILPGGSATMTATGTGTWTAQAGNPSTATITNTTSPTTTITTFTAAGTYGFIWTNGTCSDTANIVVTAKPNAGADQGVACYPLNTSATMAATGTGTWTLQGGSPGTATITNATSPNTTITAFSAAGIYNFIWTNSNGCTDTASVIVSTKPNAGPDQTVTCAKLPGGIATMAALGAGTWSAMTGNPGTATITTAASPTTTITGFTAAGTYHFIWTVSTCTDTVAVVVTAKPDAGTDQTVSCAILPGGSATMTATGTGTWSAQTGNPGTATITTPTSPTTTITTFSAAGTYNFIWTNASGCADTASVVVTAKPNAGADKTVTCAVLPGGSTAMAGTGTGTWSAQAGNPGTATITNTTSPTTTITTFSAAGTYNFIWTNASGCSDTASIVVTAKPNAGTDQTVSCAILPGGSATMTATGAGTWTTQTGNPGTATITNTTSPATTITTFSAAGTYNFIWSNASGCTDTASVVVTAKPNAGADQTVSCAVLPGGLATMSAVGTGTWSAQAGNPGTATITTSTSPTTTITTFSAAGVYSFIWTNASGCSDTATVTITQQPTVSLRDTSFCLGGSATLVPTVSPAGGSYAWSTTASSPTITVSPTTTTGYTVTYTLGLCPATASNTVTVNQLPTATVNTTPSVCTAGNGMAIANPAAGTPGYTYSWSAPGGTRDSLTSLVPGSYTVTVTDVNHCTVAASGTVGLQTPVITITELSQHDLKCFNDGTGAVYINATDTARTSSGYTYTYQWSNPSSNQNLTGVQAGTYSVLVTDQFGCTGTGSYTLSQPTALTGSTAFTDPVCFGYANGTATVTPAGGSGAYHYSWNSTPVQATQQATGLLAGSYTVVVTDDSLCTFSSTVTLTDPLAITFGAPTIINPSCFGLSNGSAQVTPQNGVGSYTYLWGNAQVTNPATALGDGTYTVTATDANGCKASTTVTVVQPSQVTVSVTETDTKCNGASNGTATATAAGGTPPYTYVWNNTDSTATITGLGIGNYTVTVTDNNGCSTSGGTTVAQPNPVTESLTSVRTNCPNTADGSIAATAAGGTGTFTYTLEDTAGNILQANSTTGNFAGLGYGVYDVVATDQNGCPVKDSISVPRAPFNYYTDTAISTTCFGVQYHDGIIHVQGYSIPNGPFQYSVDNSPFQTIPDFFDLSAGPHLVTAQDHYGCDTTFTVIVPQPLPAVVQLLPGDSTIVPGTSLQLGNVFGPYNIDSIKSYAWSPGTGMSCIDCPSPVVSPYANQTTYTLTITYNQGCTVSASVLISTNGVPPLYIPNAFTPNGDGTNDVWYVYGTGIKDFKATIFNRWGEKVFESDNQSQGWDGTFRGELQPPNVYVYLVDVVYLNGEKKTKNGSVTLIR